MRRLQAVLAVFLLAGLSACAGSANVLGVDGPDATAARQDLLPSFRTDATAYTVRSTEAGFEVTIPFTFTNAGSHTVHVVNCMGETSVQLEKLVDGEWVVAWSAAVPECLGPPIVVRTGQQWEGDVEVSSGLPGSNLYPQFEVAEIPGEYRLVWSDVVIPYNDPARAGEVLPLEQRTSNRFTLSVEAS